MNAVFFYSWTGGFCWMVFCGAGFFTGVFETQSFHASAGFEFPFPKSVADIRYSCREGALSR